MMHNGTSSCYRLVSWIGSNLVWFSFLSFECLCVCGLHGAVNITFKVTIQVIIQRQITRKRYKIELYLQWRTNRKLYVIY